MSSVNNPHPLIPGDHLTEVGNDAITRFVVAIGFVFFVMSACVLASL